MSFSEAYLVGPDGPGPKPTSAMYLCERCKLYFDEKGAPIEKSST